MCAVCLRIWKSHRMKLQTTTLAYSSRCSRSSCIIFALQKCVPKKKKKNSFRLLVARCPINLHMEPAANENVVCMIFFFFASNLSIKTSLIILYYAHYTHTHTHWYVFVSGWFFALFAESSLAARVHIYQWRRVYDLETRVYVCYIPLRTQTYAQRHKIVAFAYHCTFDIYEFLIENFANLFY